MTGIGGTVADIFAAVFVVTIIYVLVRPRSAAADMLNSFTSLLTAIVRAATDL